MAWAAEFLTDTDNSEKRSVPRRTLRLMVEAQPSGETVTTVIHNLSRTGLLIETTADLAAGEKFDITLPDLGAIEVGIVWCSGNYYGCEFVSHISGGTVSAALLRAPAKRSETEAAHAASPTQFPETTHDSDALKGLSRPAKLLIILGSSLGLWALIGLAIWGLFF